uniref:Neprosin PEP catalytic domain-containing protein n=1 Tax=Ananas comosus var. bracteatus TaxID=296719 RepID=A0A6V7P6P5_ANACO|nr:unnamed protein product [Ananas comosus var. bracteatus]
MVGEKVHGRELLKPFDPFTRKIQFGMHGKTADSEEIKHWTTYETKRSGNYYGTKAKINLWNLPHDIKPSHFSGYMMWLASDDGIINSIVAGFHVYPELYHDNKLHFFTYWTVDDYNSTGCYNLDCEGFVMVNWDVLTPGSVVNPVSIYNGQQYDITLSIKKDAQSGHWFLYREDLGEAKLIGYWPKSQFKSLADKATVISWGGMVIYDKNDISPPMGSGHFAGELERKAAYFKNIEIFYSDGKSHDLIDGAQSETAEKEECYTISELVNSSKYGQHDGHLFYFGGPGGCTD